MKSDQKWLLCTEIGVKFEKRLFWEEKVLEKTVPPLYEVFIIDVTSNMSRKMFILIRSNQCIRPLRIIHRLQYESVLKRKHFFLSPSLVVVVVARRWLRLQRFGALWWWYLFLLLHYGKAAQIWYSVLLLKYLRWSLFIALNVRWVSHLIAGRKPRNIWFSHESIHPNHLG